MTPKSWPSLVARRLQPGCSLLHPGTAGLHPGYARARQRDTPETPGLRPGNTQVAPASTELLPKFRPGVAERPCGLPRVTPAGLADGEIDADHVGASAGEVRGW